MADNTRSWALVSSEGEIIPNKLREEEPNVDQSTLAPGKPRWYPVEVVTPELKPDQVLGDPTWKFDGSKVQKVYKARKRTNDELQALVARYDARLEKIYERSQAPIEAFGELWHADDRAVMNITTALFAQSFNIGHQVKTWCPMGKGPVPMTPEKLAEILRLIMDRKQRMFEFKKSKQLALLTMSAKELANFDPEDGWDADLPSA
jgi:hypothetical protein